MAYLTPVNDIMLDVKYADDLADLYFCRNPSDGTLQIERCAEYIIGKACDINIVKFNDNIYFKLLNKVQKSNDHPLRVLFIECP